MAVKFNKDIPGRQIWMIDQKPVEDYYTYFWNGRHVWVSMGGWVRDYANDEVIGNIDCDPFHTGWKEYWRVRQFRSFFTRLTIASAAVLFMFIVALVYNYGR